MDKFIEMCQSMKSLFFSLSSFYDSFYVSSANGNTQNSLDFLFCWKKARKQDKQEEKKSRVEKVSLV